QGLNYLLNDEQDKALDVFLHLVEQDWETVDTSLALGAIFRRKGEIDKSIKLHQNLLARPALPTDYKPRVLLELGRDYLLAGWLDRAEGLFKEVLKDDALAKDALMYLMNIYQQEREWQSAINSARRSQRYNKEDLRPIIAQYYCELSDQAYQHGDLKEAEALATQGLSDDRDCVRAAIILGRIAMDRGRMNKAIRFFQQVEYQDVVYFPLIIENLATCYRNQSNLKALITYLRNVQRNHSDINLVDIIADLVNEVYDKQAAIEYLSGEMLNKPTLKGMKKLFQLQQPDENCPETHMPQMVEYLLKKQQGYQCGHCGYAANTLYWLCPSCHSWGGMKPKY
ncbi:MAG TPA: lipopolysaccharide assembly protein LapB, partial [Gammaproteobacteria bacterium]